MQIGQAGLKGTMRAVAVRHETLVGDLLIYNFLAPYVEPNLEI